MVGGQILAEVASAGLLPPSPFCYLPCWVHLVICSLHHTSFLPFHDCWASRLPSCVSLNCLLCRPQWSREASQTRHVGVCFFHFVWYVRHDAELRPDEENWFLIKITERTCSCEETLLVYLIQFLEVSPHEADGRPLSARFLRFLPLKVEFFLDAVTKCCSWRNVGYL